MRDYKFEYESVERGDSLRGSLNRDGRSADKRARGIIFSDPDESGAFFYDLRTRYPLAARVKRFLDIAMAAVLILALSPLLVVLALLVKLSGKGPVIFKQRRIGFRCNQFFMYKFRSMVAGAERKEKEMADESGTSFLKLKSDPRVTPIGRVLRKYSLDELPQLFNVLEGTMSMVGPRPLLMSDLDRLPHRSRVRRFSTPPGITGLWQVSGRSNCSEAKRLQLDRMYVDHWSLALDFEILLETVEVVLTARGAV